MVISEVPKWIVDEYGDELNALSGAELEDAVRLLEEERVIQRRLVEENEKIAEHIEARRWEFNSPYTWQARIYEFVRLKKIVVVPAPNGVGKTKELSVMVSSWMEGYEAWNECREDGIGAVKVGGKWYQPSSLGHEPPVRVRLTGVDWDNHLGQVVIPELRKWLNMDNYEVKMKDGYPYLFTHKYNGSTLELMTINQKLDSFEGWRGHAWLIDERTTKEIYNAMMRGLHEFHGKAVFFGTPLEDVWMLDTLVRAKRPDTYVVKDLVAYDNEDSYGYDSEILEELGLSGKVTRYWRESDGDKKRFFDLILDVNDQGRQAERFLREKCGDHPQYENLMTDLIFLKKAFDTDVDEKATRFFGMFKQLIGLVIKNFDRERHIIKGLEPEEIPTDYPITVMLDIHYTKPNAISFFMTDKNGINYLIDEYWLNSTPDEIADLVIRKKRVYGWNIHGVWADPLSKGDNILKNLAPELQSTHEILEARFDEEGIFFDVAPKNKGDGVRNIKKMFAGANKIPTLYIFDTCQGCEMGVRGTVYDLERVKIGKNGEIVKENDDFFENLYRFTLLGVNYDDAKPITEESGETLGEFYRGESDAEKLLFGNEDGSWMGFG